MASRKKPDGNLFDTVHDIFKRHVVAEPHYHVALALWALHTHVYRKFDVTPRLALLSPVENSGKSTVLNVMEELVSKPELLVDPTPASLFRIANGATLLIDEADNLGIERSMRTFLNAGHRVGGTVPRALPDGGVHMFPVHAPVALAAIGKLPNAVMSRSVVVRMHRAPLNAKITRFDKTNDKQSRELEAARTQAEQWASQVQLNRNPSLPVGLGRMADNWRVLLAIADDLGRGDIARKAAVKVIDIHPFQNIKILLLHDIRTVFDEQQTKKLPSRVLAEALLALEDAEGDWTEYKLTPGEMARLLNEFQIKPTNVWWPENEHRSRQQNLKGYAREDLKGMWKRYLPKL